MLLLLRVQLSETQIRNLKLIPVHWRKSSGKWAWRRPACASIWRTRPTSALGYINRTWYWSPEISSSSVMHIMFETVIRIIFMAAVVDPLPFEEEEGIFPPTFLLSLVVEGLLDPWLFFRDGFLKLEVQRVYGSRWLFLMLPCFFQHLVFNRRVNNSKLQRFCNTKNNLKKKK